MTGIVVGLGGNARNTERGRSLKQFIRSGERSSEVRVTLRNRGKEAYRPDMYGEAIVVERVISNEGAGSYRIRSAKGERKALLRINWLKLAKSHGPPKDC